MTFSSVILGFTGFTVFYLLVNHYAPIMHNRELVIRAQVAFAYSTLICILLLLQVVSHFTLLVYPVGMGYALFSLFHLFGKLDWYLNTHFNIFFRYFLSLMAYGFYGEALPYLGLIEIPEAVRGFITIKWRGIPPTAAKTVDVIVVLAFRVMYPFYLAVWIAPSCYAFVILSLMWIVQSYIMVDTLAGCF